jgi:CRP/FNR family transcriptional regulator, cyclic AMP receptor protein
MAPTVPQAQSAGRGPRQAAVEGSGPPPPPLRWRNACLAALQRSPILAGLQRDTLIGLAARSRWLQCDAGEVVVDFGDETDDVFFVVDGALRVVMRTALGHEAILNELGPGEIFGELAAIDGSPRSANVTVLRRTSLCAVPANAFIELVLNSPALGRRLLRILAARLRAKDERLLENATLTARQRLIAELLRLSRDRGGGERVLSPPPPQNVLAARISTRRETVSRELATMVRAGLLSVSRRAIVLHRPQALASEVTARLSARERAAAAAVP